MIHLILGVAGGIVLAVYAIATIERWRNRRAVRKMERMLYPQRYDLPPGCTANEWQQYMPNHISTHQREWQEYAARQPQDLPADYTIFWQFAGVVFYVGLAWLALTWFWAYH